MIIDPGGIDSTEEATHKTWLRSPWKGAEPTGPEIHQQMALDSTTTPQDAQLGVYLIFTTGGKTRKTAGNIDL